MRGTYSDAISAARLVRDLGGMAAIAAQHCGAEVLTAQGQAGDIGLAINDGRECFVVCGGAMWHAPGAAGLVAIPAKHVLRAWRLLKD